MDWELIRTVLFLIGVYVFGGIVLSALIFWATWRWFHKDNKRKDRQGKE